MILKRVASSHHSSNIPISAGEDWAAYSASWKAPSTFLILPRHMRHQREDKLKKERGLRDPRWECAKVWVRVWDNVGSILRIKKKNVLFVSGVFLAAYTERRPSVISGVQHSCLLQPASWIPCHQRSQQHQGKSNRWMLRRLDNYNKGFCKERHVKGFEV